MIKRTLHIQKFVAMPQCVLESHHFSSFEDQCCAFAGLLSNLDAPQEGQQSVDL